MKIKKEPYRLGSPKGENPFKEMSWCFSKHIYVSCVPKAVLEGKYYKQLNEYALTIKANGEIRQSEFIYNKDNIQDAIWNTYREIYKRNCKDESISSL